MATQRLWGAEACPFESWMFSHKLLKSLSIDKICLYSFPTWSNSARTADIFSQYHQQNRFHVSSVGNPRRVSDTTNLEKNFQFSFHWHSMNLRYNTYWCLNIFVNQFPFAASDQTAFQDPGCLTKGPWRRSYNRYGMPQCSNSKATWTEAQLRSADEGSNIFYCCRKCRHRYATYKML